MISQYSVEKTLDNNDISLQRLTNNLTTFSSSPTISRNKCYHASYHASYHDSAIFVNEAQSFEINNFKKTKFCRCFFGLEILTFCTKVTLDPFYQYGKK